MDKLPPMPAAPSAAPTAEALSLASSSAAPVTLTFTWRAVGTRLRPCRLWAHEELAGLGGRA